MKATDSFQSQASLQAGTEKSRIFSLAAPLRRGFGLVDHSVQVDSFGERASFDMNVAREFERNRERYAFLRWAQNSFHGFRVVPPGTGIVHQVNLEYLAQVVFREPGENPLVYPDSLLG